MLVYSGRPGETTAAAGYSVGASGGQPEGTTAAAGYSVGNWWSTWGEQ